MATVLTWLPLIGAGLMFLIGLMCLINPWPMLKPMGISSSLPLGTSEIRAVFGGINMGLGVAAIWLQDPAVFLALGCAWSAATAARVYSIVADGCTLKESIPAFIVDGGLAALFLSSLL